MGNVEHSNFNCWLRKGDQLLTSLYDFFFFFYKMQIFLPFNSFMLWAILFAIKLYYSLHSFCIFWTFLFCLSALSHVASLFCFFVFLLCGFCSVKLPEKQFYSMNIKPLLEDSINLFHYLQLLRLLYDHCVRACVCVCVWRLCVCLFNYRPPFA